MTDLERYGHQGKRPHGIGPAVSRRGFLGGTAGLTFAIAFGAKGLSLISEAQAKAVEHELGAWVRIATDNLITIITPAAEMGQGSMTGVPVALAEEMDADWGKVSLEMAPADPETYGYVSWGGRKSMGIYGSLAVRSYYNQMRLVGAQVRKVLLQAAAKEWGVEPTELTTEPSVVVHGASNRRLSYSEIAAFAQLPARMPEVAKSELKKRSQFRLIGKSVPRHDIPDKVNGRAQFAIDVQLPGMVYASTVHAPVQLAKPMSWNQAEIMALPGIVGTVALERGVAVVADSFEHVLAARDALEVRWAKGASAEGYDSEPTLDQTYAEIAKDQNVASKTVKSAGDVDAAFAEAAKIYKANFRSDYGYHAQMEPLNGVARFNREGDRVEIWEGTQAPGRSREMIARALGFTRDQVIHHQQYLGGRRRSSAWKRRWTGTARSRAGGTAWSATAGA
jgi:isoquinoline 1-oxidoreductase beta subunit